MRQLHYYPLSASVGALTTTCGRLFIFFVTIMAGAHCPTMLSSDTGGSIGTLILAPYAWLVSPVYLVANVITLLCFYLVLRVESTMVFLLVLSVSFSVWFYTCAVVWT